MSRNKNLPSWYHEVAEKALYVHRVCKNSNNIIWLNDYLAGACAIASKNLVKLIDKKHKPQLVAGVWFGPGLTSAKKLIETGGSNHVWVEIGGWIIDPTYSQFDENYSVLFIEKTAEEAKFFHKQWRSNVRNKDYELWGIQNPDLWKIQDDKLVMKDKINETLYGFQRNKKVHFQFT